MPVMSSPSSGGEEQGAAATRPTAAARRRECGVGMREAVMSIHLVVSVLWLFREQAKPPRGRRVMRARERGSAYSRRTDRRVRSGARGGGSGRATTATWARSRAGHSGCRASADLRSAVRTHAPSRTATQSDSTFMAMAGPSEDVELDVSVPSWPPATLSEGRPVGSWPGAAVSVAAEWGAGLTVECVDSLGCPMLCIAKTPRASTRTSRRCPRASPARTRQLTFIGAPSDAWLTASNLLLRQYPGGVGRVGGAGVFY